MPDRAAPGAARSQVKIRDVRKPAFIVVIITATAPL